MYNKIKQYNTTYYYLIFSSPSPGSFIIWVIRLRGWIIIIITITFNMFFIFTLKIYYLCSKTTLKTVLLFISYHSKQNVSVTKCTKIGGIILGEVTLTEVSLRSSTPWKKKIGTILILSLFHKYQKCRILILCLYDKNKYFSIYDL